MPFDPIIWPPSPTVGQSFTSDYGRTWWWDGCGWVASCCPPDTCTYADGVTVWAYLNAGDLGNLYTTAFLEYQGLDGNGNAFFVGITNDVSNPDTLELYFDTGTSLWTLIDTVGGNAITIATTSATPPYGSYTVVANGLITVDAYCGQNADQWCITFESTSTAESFSVTSNGLYSALLDPVPQYIFAETNFPNLGSVSVSYNGTDWVASVNANNTGLSECTDIVLGSDPNLVPTGSWACGSGTLTITNSACVCDPAINGISVLVSYATGPFAGSYAYLPGIINGSGTYVVPYTTGGGSLLLSYNSGTNTWSLNEGINVLGTLTGASPVGVYSDTSELYDSIEVICGRPYPALCYVVSSTVPSTVTTYTLFATMAVPGGLPTSYIEGDAPTGQSITWNSGLSQWQDDITAALTLPLSDSYFIQDPGGNSWTSTDSNLSANSLLTLTGCGLT